MKAIHSSKKKIFNDPVYGFISVPSELIFDLIQHPYFQRLRRISQLGLTHLVYTGANHSRFQHTLGAMHLMTQAIEVLRFKGIEITSAEAEGATIAILLHDIGHGPYSHTLEHSLVEGVNHEDISTLIMNELNSTMEGKLELAIQIFRDQYHKKFLHQLVSSQLDVDRLDYLKRDSFFSGVSEGAVSSDRLIKLLYVKDDNLVVEAKGIYSVEKFIIARRLMYWQVYLHKAVIGAEFLLMKILQRARQLAERGEELFCSPFLKVFLYERPGRKDFAENQRFLKAFTSLDDFDILSAIKVWTTHEDYTLSKLSQGLIYRELYRVELQAEPFSAEQIAELRKEVMEQRNISAEEAEFFVFSDIITNSAYNPKSDKIKILFKDGTTKDIAEAADLLNIRALSEAVVKHFLCSPKNI